MIMQACSKKPGFVGAALVALLFARPMDAHEGENSQYLGVAWAAPCEDAMVALEARGFSFDPLTVFRHSPVPPHVVEAPRGVPVCTPSEADAFGDDPQTYQAVRGSTGLIKVELICRRGRFVGIANRVNKAAAAEYLCILRAAGEVHTRVLAGGRITEVRDRKEGGVRYLEQDEGDQFVVYTVLSDSEDARIRKSQQVCALEKAKSLLD